MEIVVNIIVKGNMLGSDCYIARGVSWRCRYLCRQTKIRIFKSLVIPVLLYGCETWTLNTDMNWRIDIFGTRCLRKIMGYGILNFVQSQISDCSKRPIRDLLLA